ncbi:thiamine ABC transporter substrate binding subunit [Falsirhodobacter sp. 20TX0035]|uniref:thiamine ABC transporter substrate binding subunit n=1 Tax=Falsirhodobacter sp. 20TX0035 TaxID=3022019 RepID=UPI00232BFF29|nr:thiamine ABC transporter substrate binding subunit [Falsirhodobacter sp. 20TX0035]MDB6452814.1 thiamine ABC transporter substrate binding subunit [Falsirhodobacter sp. 20TX0035]
MRLLLLTAFLPAAAFAQTPTLQVMTYDSFVGEWGPGPRIEQAFEAECACNLVFTAPGDAAAMLARLKLEGARGRTDVVVGLDANLLAEAQATDLFVPHGTVPAVDLPVDWTDTTFLPFDWGWFGFVMNADMPQPHSFQELADSDLKVVIQDPRSSTPGLGLVMWMKAAHGDGAGTLWEGLADNILTVTPGWSEAYGLFTAGEADAVLSYTTSPAYHLLEEGDSGKVAPIFREGHYLQVEVAARLAASAQPELADRFLAFLLSDNAQRTIATTNWMYPARDVPLPEAFAGLPRPDKTLFLPPADAAAARDAAIAEWQAALSR